MNFDEEIDKYKSELAGKRLSGEQIIQATKDLRGELEKTFDSKRLKFEYDFDEEEGPRIGIFYKDENFLIGTSWVQADGSVGFGSESEYFPPLMAAPNKEEFQKEAFEFLKEGLAHFESDEEAEMREV